MFLGKENTLYLVKNKNRSNSYGFCFFKTLKSILITSFDAVEIFLLLLDDVYEI